MNEPSSRSDIRVLVVARYPAARAGLRAMLDGRDGIRVVGEAGSMDDLGEFTEAHADVLVIDAERPRTDELAAIEIPAVVIGSGAPSFRGVSANRPGAWLLPDAEAPDIAAAITAVARGLLVLDPALAAEVRAAPAPHLTDSSTEVTLTARERAVLGLVALGLPNKGIARELGISEHTVKFHVGAVLGKLGAASRAEAVAMAARQGLLPL